MKASFGQSRIGRLCINFLFVALLTRLAASHEPQFGYAAWEGFEVIGLPPVRRYIDPFSLTPVPLYYLHSHLYAPIAAPILGIRGLLLDPFSLTPLVVPYQIAPPIPQVETIDEPVIVELPPGASIQRVATPSVDAPAISAVSTLAARPVPSLAIESSELVHLDFPPASTVRKSSLLAVGEGSN